MPLTTEQQQVLEETSAVFTATLLSDKTDPDSTISSANLSSLTLTLYDKCTGTILNSRENQNVLNANNCTVDVNGLFTWNIQADDNQIVSTTLDAGEYEEHVGLLTWVWSSGQGREEILLRVQQLDKVS